MRSDAPSQTRQCRERKMKPGLLSESVREACDSNVAGRPMQTAGRIESTVD